MLLRSIDALKTFDLLYATKGRGGGSTNEVETLNILAYGESFEYSQYGSAAALLILFFVLIMAVLTTLALLRRKATRVRAPSNSTGRHPAATAPLCPSTGRRSAGGSAASPARSRSSSYSSCCSSRCCGCCSRASRPPSRSSDPSRVLNFTPTLTNYGNVVAQGDFLRFIFNSFLVPAAATLVSLVVGVPAAYAIARYRVAHATTFLLMARIIPGVSLLVPWYFLFAQIQLVGTYAVLVLTHVFVAMPLVVAIMASFVEGLPVELEEAGQVDGLTRIGAFLRVTLPLSTPGIATAAILSFIFSWNNFLFALVLSDQNTRTLPVAIANFTAYASVDWGGLMAASVLITVPVMAIALLAQRYVVSGLTAGATKG